MPHTQSLCNLESCLPEKQSSVCNCCCHENKPHHPHEERDFAHELISMADQAWMEVLKEKIKEQIKSSQTEHLDQLASIVSETNKIRWKHKLLIQKDIREFKDKLTSFFEK